MSSTLGWNKVAAAIVVAGVLGTACAQDSTPAPGASVPQPSTAPAAPGPAGNAGQAAERFKAAGKGASLTVLPTRMAGTPMAQVGEVVAMMLERGGMTNVDTSADAFTPPAGADLAQSAAAFAEFVKAKPLPTGYALYTEFALSREKGVSEVRGIVVNGKGEVAWQDRQVKGDADFDRVNPREPMECCILVVERLRPVLGLGDFKSENAPAGKVAQRWQKKTGLPDKAELDAIEERGKVFKRSAAESKLVVLPARAGGDLSAESAEAIAAMINDKKLAKASVAPQGPKLDVVRDMNEQKVLWSMAHGFSEYVTKNPPDADYVLFADYLMGKNAVGGVHFAVCNKQGELVVVDFQNSHWPDFNAINPKSREDCDKLVLKRLQGYCK